METKKLIIIGVLAVIICILVGAIIGTLNLSNNSVDYERIEIVPNGTSIEIPTSQAKYLGDTEGVKFWNWTDGALVTYNSQEGSNAVELSGALGFYAVKELVRAGASENIDGFTVYTLDANQLTDSIKTNGNGEFYCVHLFNDTTHDNIVICCKDKDVLLHIAKSIQYKKSNNDTVEENNVNSVNLNSSGLSQEDIDKARQEGYDSGYVDGYDDSYDDYYYDDEYEDFDSSSSSSSSDSSSSSSSDAETTTSDT